MANQLLASDDVLKIYTEAVAKMGDSFVSAANAAKSAMDAFAFSVALSGQWDFGAGEGEKREDEDPSRELSLQRLRAME